ncbi:hypothetical protein F53441_6368 [Fusarium austroafricanum]|uniref:Uncharacterized protein n=1 Tax=Fusarium austroafricanum TaxID=2364996 RepID=A0A8H4NYQ1_9HYPO|nr:hypothetical protein F53441_6368 [Fusarium austroafricanum]
MDVFSKLPLLALINIIVHTESERELLQLVGASPEMLQTYIHNRRTIMRERLNRILAIDTDGEILQDARAVLHFHMRVVQGSHLPTTAAIFETLTLWKNNEFSNPLIERDLTNISKLYRFFSRQIAFIEDYLAKALDPFPARARMTLPDIRSVAPTMRFKGRAVDIKPVAFGSLQESERYHLLWAFVKYELLCKIYSENVWKHIEKSLSAETIKRSYDKLALKDYERLYCVDGYFESLYGAIYAHCTNMWLPDRPLESKSRNRIEAQEVAEKQQYLPSPEEYGLVYPDTVYFDPKDYGWDIERYGLEYTLPSLGLDTFYSIMAILGEDNSSLRQLEHSLRLLGKQFGPFRRRSWMGNGHFGSSHIELIISKERIWDWDNELESRQDFIIPPGLDEQEEWFIEYKMGCCFDDLQTKIFRQRAWVFLDGSGRRSHLPTSDELKTDEKAHSHMSEVTRIRRREQRWQDYWFGRSNDRPDDGLDVESDWEPDTYDSDDYEECSLVGCFN